MMKIAIIGGIGCGKSKVCEVLTNMGHIVLDCDKIYKELSFNKEYLDLVELNFPGAVQEGKLDRQYLGKLVFSNKKDLEKLNNIAHPLVIKRLEEMVLQIDKDVVFIETQVINDTLKEYFDKILYVSADMKIRIQRIIKRSGYSKDHIKRIIASQPSEEQFEKIADYIIINNKTENDIKNQIIKVLNFIF